MDRVYGYQPARSSVSRDSQPGRGSTGTLASRDYYEPYYANTHGSTERVAPRPDPRTYQRTVPVVRRAADDYDVAPRRLLAEPRHEGRPRGSSMTPTERRPLHIVPPTPSQHLQPVVRSAGGDRRPIETSSYYVVPASSGSARAGHGRHLSADVDDRGRYVYSTRPPERQAQYAPSSRGGYYGPDPGRRSDEGFDRRAYDAPLSRGHLYPEQPVRRRAGSDVGVQGRPRIEPEYIRTRPREGPPPSTRGFDKLDRASSIRNEYRLPREDALSSTSSGGSGYRVDDRDRRRLNQQPVALHQDYEYGYSSAEDGRRSDKRHRPRRSDSRERRYDEGYDSDADKHSKHHRDKPYRADEPEDRQTKHRHRRQESEDRYSSRRDDDDKRSHKSRRDDDYDDDREKRHRARDDRDHDKSDKVKSTAEALGLGGAGAALLGLAKNVVKQRVGLSGDSDDEKESYKDRSDRYGEDGPRRRKRDETEEERKERHRRRREQETEEEAQERRRRRRERKDHRERDEDGKDDRDGRERSVAAAAAGATGGAAASLGAGLTGNRDKERDKSQDRDPSQTREHDRSRVRTEEDDEQRRRRRRRKSHSHRETGSSSSSSSSETDIRPPSMRSRANSSARGVPAKGILKPPTPKFPENPDAIREGVAPLKDAKGDKSIPPDARWTKIHRRLVNPDTLQEAQERFEERVDHVIVLRVLTKKEIEKFAKRTQELREERHKRNRLADLEDRERGLDDEDRTPLAIDSQPHNFDPIAENAVRNAAEISRNSPPRVSQQHEQRPPSPLYAAAQHPSFVPQGYPPQQQQMPLPSQSQMGPYAERPVPANAPPDQQGMTASTAPGPGPGSEEGMMNGVNGAVGGPTRSGSNNGTQQPLGMSQPNGNFMSGAQPNNVEGQEYGQSIGQAEGR